MSKRSRFIFTYLAPAVFLYALFVGVPLVQTFYYSLFRWKGVSSKMKFVGAKNLVDVAQNDVTRTAAVNQVLLLVCGGFLLIGVGVAIAHALAQKNALSRAVQTVMLFPQVVSIVVVGIMWSFLLNPSFGISAAIGWPRLENGILGTVGWANLAVLLAFVWHAIGFYVLLFGAGLSSLDTEVIEAANILNHATERSLVILDEVGRGTSTYDGLAIAWAMVEHLIETRSKTLFATHYHQLNAIAEKAPTVQNFRVSVEEFGDDIVWTHRVLPGGADRSYGIHVARMAGVPGAVLRRASEILGELEQDKPPTPVETQTKRLQMTLFEFDQPPVVEALEKLDVNQLTPLEALRLLDEWKRKFL